MSSEKKKMMIKHQKKSKEKRRAQSCPQAMEGSSIESN